MKPFKNPSAKNTKTQTIVDDYEFLRIGYDGAIAKLMALGHTEVQADNLLINNLSKQPDGENRLRLMEVGLG